MLKGDMKNNWFLDFSAHIALQVDMIQVVAASKVRWPGDLLPETL